MRTTPYKLGEPILVIHPQLGPLAGIVAEIREEMVLGRFNGHDGLVPLDDEEVRDVNFEKLWEYHQSLIWAINSLREGMELSMEPEEYEGTDDDAPLEQPLWKDLLMRMDGKEIEEEMDRLFDAEQMEWWDKQIYRKPFDAVFEDEQSGIDDQEDDEDKADWWKA